jgi:hypothetical protein
MFVSFKNCRKAYVIFECQEELTFMNSNALTIDSLQLESAQSLDHFLALRDRLSLAFKRDLSERPLFSGKEAQRFCSLGPKDQTNSLRWLENMCVSHLGSLEEALGKKDLSLSALEVVEKCEGVRVDREFKRRIEKGDLVEIFDFQGQQVFRNLNFSMLSDYCIDDFFGRTWDELYERSIRFNNLLSEKVEEVRKGGRTIPFGIPKHYMRERLSPKKKVVEVELKFLGPAFNEKSEAVLWIASSSARPVSESSGDKMEWLHFI